MDFSTHTDPECPYFLFFSLADFDAMLFGALEAQALAENKNEGNATSRADQIPRPQRMLGRLDFAQLSMERSLTSM